MKLKHFFSSAILSIALISMNACATSNKLYSAKGTVQNIEFGKDGYTASLKAADGTEFDAVISRVKMETGYKTLKAGDEVRLYGDTIRLDNKLRIIVNKIEP